MKIRKHRIFTAVTLVILLFTTLLAAQSGRIQTSDDRATAVATAVRTALGSEKNIGNIKSIVITGTMTVTVTTTRIDGGLPAATATGKSSQSVEIRLLLPDNMMKIQSLTFPGMNLPMAIHEGVSGGESRNASPGMSSSSQSGAAPQVEYRPIISKDPTAVAPKLDEMARLLLGMMFRSGPVTPLTMTYSNGEFTVAKLDGILGTIEFDPKTNYPSAILYKEITTMPSIVTDSATGSASIGPRKSQSMDMIMRFHDQAAVNGVMFPHTITWKSSENSPRPIDRELKIEKIQINSGLTLKDFELPK